MQICRLAQLKPFRIHTSQIVLTCLTSVSPPFFMCFFLFFLFFLSVLLKPPSKKEGQRPGRADSDRSGRAKKKQPWVLVLHCQLSRRWAANYWQRPGKCLVAMMNSVRTVIIWNHKVFRETIAGIAGFILGMTTKRLLKLFEAPVWLVCLPSLDRGTFHL